MAVGKTRMRAALKQQPLKGLKPKDVELFQSNCRFCAKGKITNSHMSSSNNRATKPGDVVCCDSAGPQRIKSRSGALYGCVVIDEASNYVFSKAIATLMLSVTFLAYVLRRELKSVTRIVRTDRGTEWMNHRLDELLEEVGAKHQTACTGRHEQNGRPEKGIRDLWDMMRTAIAACCLTIFFWDMSLNWATLHHNYLPCTSNPECKSPYEMFYGVKPDLRRLHAFGEACEVAFTPEERTANGKLHSRTMPGIHVGYDDATGSKAWLIFIPELNKIVSRCDVKFMGYQAKMNGRDTSDVKDFVFQLPTEDQVE